MRGAVLATLTLAAALIGCGSHAPSLPACGPTEPTVDLGFHAAGGGSQPMTQGPAGPPPTPTPGTRITATGQAGETLVLELVGYEPLSKETLCFSANVRGSYVAGSTSLTPTAALVTIDRVQNGYVHGTLIKAWVGTSGEPGLVGGFPFDGPQYLP